MVDILFSILLLNGDIYGAQTLTPHHQATQQSNPVFYKGFQQTCEKKNYVALGPKQVHVHIVA